MHYCYPFGDFARLALLNNVYLARHLTQCQRVTLDLRRGAAFLGIETFFGRTCGARQKLLTISLVF